MTAQPSMLDSLTKSTVIFIFDSHVVPSREVNLFSKAKKALFLDCYENASLQNIKMKDVNSEYVWALHVTCPEVFFLDFRQYWGCP